MSRRLIDTSQLGPITCLPDAADELAKAVDAIQAAEGALCRAIAMLPQNDALPAELPRLRQVRQRLLAERGGPKADPVHFVGGGILP